MANPNPHNNKKKTTEEFINQAKQIWGDRYDFSKVNYESANKPVCVICPEYGEFWIRPADLLHRHGCSYCGGTRKLTTREFIEKAQKVHGDRYDYSKVEYVNTSTPVEIICHEKDSSGVEHGSFFQSPRNHLNGDGCPKCYRNFKKTTEEFIEQARLIHGDKYDYSKVIYKGNKVPVIITCPVHGDFMQAPLSHLQGQGCAKCYYERSAKQRAIGTEKFIENARKVHGDKYDYSKVEYKNNRTPVCIICPKHGEFWQKPENHVIRKQGCPKCSESHMEREVDNCLKSLNITFVREKKFKWLIDKSYLPLDFYLPEYNVAIECQGDQHFRSYDAFGGELSLKEIQRRDIIKNELCKNNNIKLLYLVPRTSFIGILPIYNETNTFNDIKSLIRKIQCLNEMTIFEEIVNEILSGNKVC